MKTLPRFQRRSLVLIASLCLMVSCSRADVVPDIKSLRQQIDKSDPEVITALAGSSDARSYLQRLHPGALFYLASSLQRGGVHAEARMLFREQLVTGAPAWRDLSFRGWLEAGVGLKDWQGIIDQAPGLYQRLREVPGKDAGGLAVVPAAETAASEDAYHRAMVESFSQLRRWDAAWQEARSWRDSLAAADKSGVAQAAGIGEAGEPAWLTSQVARLALHRSGAIRYPLSGDLMAEMLPYALGIEARQGHGDLLRLLDEGIRLGHEAAGPAAGTAATVPATERTPASASGGDQVLRELLQAKDLLARDQAVEAWHILRAWLLPALPVAPAKNKASKAVLARYAQEKADFETARQHQADLVALHRQAGLPPLMYIRDLYNAARLAGRFTEGMAVLDALRTEILAAVPEWRETACVPYAMELKGRLARAAGNWKVAVQTFREALPLARQSEESGRMAAEDRRRIQWYLLSSMVEAVPDFSGQLFDLDGFLRLAAGCDQPEYFSDVWEAAQQKIASRHDWAALERFDRELAAVLPPLLHWRNFLLLARGRQLAAPGKSDADARFQELTTALANQTDSLYYQMVGRWMRGEPSVVGDLLARRPGLAAFAGAGRETEAGDVLNWTETVSEGYWSMGMYDPGWDFAWSHRTELSPAFFTRLGSRYVSVGRFRQGLRILDSVRLRVGHPEQRALLEAFYPRPYAAAMAEAVNLPAATVVPEWLMYALTRTESLFDPGAQSGPGARGLAQLMPATARLVAKDLKIEDPDLQDPALNLKLGTVYLGKQFRALGQWPQSLAAYNAGAGRVRAWEKAGIGNDPIIFSELIPFEETRNYVRRIIESAAIYAWLYDQTDAGQVLSIVYTPGSTYRQ